MGSRRWSWSTGPGAERFPSRGTPVSDRRAQDFGLEGLFLLLSQPGPPLTGPCVWLGWGLSGAPEPQGEGRTVLSGRGGSGLASLRVGSWRGQCPPWPCSLVCVLCPVPPPWATGILRSIGLGADTGELAVGVHHWHPRLNPRWPQSQSLGPPCLKAARYPLITSRRLREEQTQPEEALCAWLLKGGWIDPTWSGAGAESGGFTSQEG